MRPLFSDSPSISCKQPVWKHYLFREQTLHRATEQMGPARSSHYPPADFWFILEASAFLSSLSLENLWSPDSSFPRRAEGEAVPLTLTWKLLHQMNLKGQWESGWATAFTWKWQWTFSANRCWCQSTQFCYFLTVELPTIWVSLFLTILFHNFIFCSQLTLLIIYSQTYSFNHRVTRNYLEMHK